MTTLTRLLTIVLAASIFILMAYCGKRQQETSSNSEIEANVESVSMQTISGPSSNIFEPTADASPDPKSTVIIKLQGRPNEEFHILTSRIVKQKGFTDLEGKHEFMGGLMILSELQNRLVGKAVVLRYAKPSEEGESRIYPVAELRLSNH